MNKDLREYANKAFKAGQINGKAFVIKNYLRNAIERLNWDLPDAEGYIKDALKGIDEIAKLSKEI